MRVVWTLLLLGCPGRPSLGPPSPGLWERDLPAVSSDIVAKPGAVGEAWVRATNTYGVATDTNFVSVTEAGLERAETPDSFGYAVLPFTEPGLHPIAAGGIEVEVASYGALWQGFGGLAWGAPGPAAPTGDGMQGGDGVVIADGNTLWWTSSSGGTHAALVADGPITLVRSGELDGDEVLDVIASSENALYVLRGRPGGGLSWVGRLTAPNHTVGAFDIGDADDDGINDIAVVWKGQIEGDLLDVWRGDGLLGYATGPTRHLTQPTAGLTISAFGPDDEDEVAVNHEGLNFDLFYASDTVFRPTGPRLLLETPEQASALSPGDFDGDGLEELFFAGPNQGPLGRRLQMVELGPDPSVSNFDREEGGYFAFQDYTGDGRPDVLWAQDNGVLYAMHSTGSEIQTRNLGNTNGGPVAFEDPERFVVAEAEGWMWNQLVSGGERFVDLRNRTLVSPGLTLSGGVFGHQDLDGDGRLEILGVREGLDRTDLRIWELLPDGAHQLGRVRLEETPQQVVDIEVCGDRAWVLLTLGLHLVDISDPAVPTLVGSIPVAGRELACTTDSVLVLVGNDVVTLNTDLAQVTAQDIPGINGMWVDAEGLATCTEQDCTIVRTQGSTWVGSSRGATRDGVDIEGGGAVSLGDIDGNGLDDVLFNEDGRITVYRATPDGFGPPELHRTFLMLQGPLAFHDHDGDGSMDAIGMDLVNDRMRITPSLTDPIEPGDTGDTGDTGLVGDTASTGDTGSAAGTGHTGDTGQTSIP